MDIFTKDFSDGEMARDWTLSESDIKQILTVISSYRLYFAIQLCVIPLQGAFLASPSELSPRIINYLNSQLNLPGNSNNFPLSSFFKLWCFKIHSILLNYEMSKMDEVLIESTEHHLMEEEGKMPKVKELFGESELEALGKKMQEQKENYRKGSQ